MLEKEKKGGWINCGRGKAFSVKSDKSESVFLMGKPVCECFSAAYRVSACWMSVKNGSHFESIPEETQFLLLKNGKRYTLIFALADGAVRTALFSADGGLYARAETYDTKTAVGEAYAAYAVEGENPYELVSCSYEELSVLLGTFSVKKDKKPPCFTEYFGFCTYNAFGCEVTEENIFKMADYFKKRSLAVGFVIADDGWQTHEENMLASFEADGKKFPHGLAPVIRRLKTDYGIKKFLCWHTYNGYWRGIKAECFPQYTVDKKYFRIPRRFGNAVGGGAGRLNTATGCFYPDNILDLPCGFVQGELYAFYRDFYAALKKQGVDGVKLDAMAWIEAFAQDNGGRVAMTKNMTRGLERASEEFFGGEHINCSSCANDFFYNSHAVGVTRLSTDYFPDDKNSYADHLYSNAYVGFWTQPLVFGDWDMFQSGNEAGSLHAKARAISGGPVYCSDNLDTLDCGVIAPLVSKNGFVARCLKNAVPARDCLFMDIRAEKRPLKFFNATPAGYVLGIFNCTETELAGTAALKDVDDLPAGSYAVYSDIRGLLGAFNETQKVEFSLKSFEGEIITMVPVVSGYAVIGLKEKYNPSGFVKKVCHGEKDIEISVLDEGTYLIYDERKNALMETNDENKKIRRQKRTARI